MSLIIFPLLRHATLFHTYAHLLFQLRLAQVRLGSDGIFQALLRLLKLRNLHVLIFDFLAQGVDLRTMGHLLQRLQRLKSRWTSKKDLRLDAFTSVRLQAALIVIRVAASALEPAQRWDLVQAGIHHLQHGFITMLWYISYDYLRSHCHRRLLFRQARWLHNIEHSRLGYALPGHAWHKVSVLALCRTIFEVLIGDLHLHLIFDNWVCHVTFSNCMIVCQNRHLILNT